MLAKPWQTYEGHIRDCLTVWNFIADQMQGSLGTISSRYGVTGEEFFHLVRFGILFHDAGKATAAFQKKMNGSLKDLAPHTPFSVAVLLALPQPREQDIPWLLLVFAVAAHHAVLHNETYERWGRGPNCPMDLTTVLRVAEWGGIPLEISPHLVVKPVHVLTRWRRLKDRVLPEDHGAVSAERLQRKALFSLFNYHISMADKWASRLAEETFRRATGSKDGTRATGLKLDGTKAAEGLKEAGACVTPSMAAESWPRVWWERVGIDKTRNPFQKRVLDTTKNGQRYLIVHAGCGQGKTLAALDFARFWMDRGEANRAIFCLPTQFTSNALFAQMTSNYKIPPEAVGLYHSDALQVLGRNRGEDEEDVREAARDTAFLSELYAKPVTVSTVDHLLYSFVHAFRFADTTFGAVVQSVVIFDELHFYDEFTLGKVITAIRLLRRLNVPHLILSATLPSSLINGLQNAEWASFCGESADDTEPLYAVVRQEEEWPRGNHESDSSGGGKDTPVSSRTTPVAFDLPCGEGERDGRSEDQPFEFRRLRGPILEKDPERPFWQGATLGSETRKLLADTAGLRRAIYVNQIEHAKAVYRALKDEFRDENVILYHSEFSRADKEVKERAIHRLFSSGSWSASEEREMAEHHFRRDAGVIFVATQIAEISLDYSADLTISALAPVDSLLQRGGRLHRKGKHHERDGCRRRSADGEACAQCDRHSDGFRYSFYVEPYPAEKGLLLPYVQDGTDSDVLRRTDDVIRDGMPYRFSASVEWTDRVYAEDFRNVCCGDEAFLRAVHEDVIFGERPEQRVGVARGEDSTGSFQVRDIKTSKIPIIPLSVWERFQVELQTVDWLSYTVPAKGWQIKDKKPLHSTEPHQLLVYDIHYSWEVGLEVAGSNQTAPEKM